MRPAGTPGSDRERGREGERERGREVVKQTKRER